MKQVKRVNQVYLDYAAGTPMREGVLKAMAPYFSDCFGNTGSIHQMGDDARVVLDNAREQVRVSLGAACCDKIIFTGSGTESINIALRGVVLDAFFKNGMKKVHVISSIIEHKAVLETLADLKAMGYLDVTLVGVDSCGMVKVPEVLGLIQKNTVLVSLHYVHNELGVVQRVGLLGKELKRRGVLFHVDACQAFCYFSCSVIDLYCDLLTLNSSKVGGPKGVGLLYAREGVGLRSVITGGSQEFGLRAGTENVAGIVGFVQALQISSRNRVNENIRLRGLQKYFWKEISSRVSDVKCNSNLKTGSPHILSISIRGVEGEHVVRYLSEKGFYVSTGSACTSSEVKVSSSVLALGVDPLYAAGTVRFSLGWGTRKSDIRSTVKALCFVISALKKI